MAVQKTRGVRIPSPTLVVVAFSLVVYCCPGLPEMLVYDRRAILGGELWRPMTAPFVHFSMSHLGWDLLVLIAAGWAIEAAGHRGLPAVCGFAAVVPSLVYLLTSPELARYGGLSGMATGAVVYLCLCNWQKSDKSRIIWLLILALTAMKIILELVTKTPIFALTEGEPFHVLPSAHALGCMGALATALWRWPQNDAYKPGNMAQSLSLI